MGYSILSLDGGGAKGAYTLGALAEIEARLGGGPLCRRFDMIFGTSTGAIIASLLGLGWSVDAIYQEYLKIIPSSFSKKSAKLISTELRQHAEDIFKDRKFDRFQTRIGLVATNVDQDRAMIFKSHMDQVYTGTTKSLPGSGLQ